MRLLLITHAYPYGKGETYLETEIKYTAENYDEVVILSLSQDWERTRQVPENVRVIKLGRKYRLLTCAAYALMALLSAGTICEIKNVRKLEHKPSIKNMLVQMIKSNMLYKRIDLAVRQYGLSGKDTVGYSYWLNQSAYYLSRNSDRFAYTVARAHGYELRDNEVYMPFRKITDRGLDEIAFISENAKRQYLRILAPIGGSREALNKTIRRLGVKANGVKKYAQSTFRIVSCSAIYPLKRLDLLVDALALLPEHCSVEWVHFGGGKDEDAIRERCHEKLDNKSNITWKLMGWVDNDTVNNYYAENPVSLFVNVSDMEGVPVSIMEAQSFGIPGMARGVGGNPEIVVSGESGWLLPEQCTPQKLADAIEEVYDEKSSISPEQVFEFFKGRYDADENYKEFYRHLNECKKENER